MTEGLSLGPLLIRWNGLLIALGIATGALLAAREAKRRDDDPEIIYYLFLPLTIWGMFGARLWHILTPSLSSLELGLTTQYYFSHLIDFVAFWIGGFGIPGAWIGGTLALYILRAKMNSHFWNWLTSSPPDLPLPKPLDASEIISTRNCTACPPICPGRYLLTPPHRLSGFEKVNFYHPLFAYESLLNFANMIFLLWLCPPFCRDSQSG